MGASTPRDIRDYLRPKNGAAPSPLLLNPSHLLPLDQSKALKLAKVLGFQGLHNDFVNVHLPHKKPRGKELSEIQKEKNKAFSAQRVACEHAHAGIKRYNAVTSIYRNRVADFDGIATGLWNLYLEAGRKTKK